MANKAPVVAPEKRKDAVGGFDYVFMIMTMSPCNRDEGRIANRENPFL
jgi:hypothetical protein